MGQYPFSSLLRPKFMDSNSIAPLVLQDTLSEHPERFFVAEIVREKIFELYQQEIPYAATVQFFVKKGSRALLALADKQ